MPLWEFVVCFPTAMKLVHILNLCCLHDSINYGVLNFAYCDHMDTCKVSGPFSTCNIRCDLSEHVGPSVAFPGPFEALLKNNQ
jgi:hypothetical protein